MATWHTDIDAGGARQLKDGRWEYERVGIAEGVAGIGHAKHRNACDTPGVPSIGDLHPDDPDAVLEERVPSIIPGHTSDFRITLIYRTPPDVNPRITIGSSLTEEEADTDVDGNLMELAYTDKNGNEKKQNVTLPNDVGLSTIVIDTVENESPGAKSRNYVGRLNLAGWSLDGGAAAGTWKCEEITGTSDDGAVTWHVHHAFAYKADGWHKNAGWLDPTTGRMPDDIDTNASAPNSRKTFELKAEVDFDAIPGL